MDLSKALAKILEGTSVKRIHVVANILKGGGVGTAGDLKYFDWNSLKDLGGLSNMEVNKIMRYIQEKFPEEYEEYKRKRTEERNLQNEVEILNFKAEHEKKLQQVKMKFEEEAEKRLKELQEMEEQLKCSQGQSDTSKGKSSSWKKKPMEYWNDLKKKCAAIYETGDDKDMTIEQAVSKIFDENSPVIEPVTSFLKSQKIAKAKDMSNLDWETLKCCEEWTTLQIKKIKEFVEKSFPENNTKHKNWNCKAEVQNRQPSKCENMAFEQWEQPRTDENIEEVIYEIFAEFSTESRINKIIEILLEDDITRAGELSCFDWKLLEDLGLTSSEATRIMDFVKEKFPKHYKKHEIRRHEANRVQEEHKAEINVLLKLEAKQSREKKTEDVGMQEKQSTSQTEATELRQKIDEASCNKIEDQTQTTNSIQLQESQKSSSNSETKNFQTREECSNQQAGNPPNDKFKDSNSNNNNNTSNDQQQKSEEDNQSLERQLSPHCEVIETEKIGNSSNNTDKSKDESQVKDVANLNYGRSTEV